MKTDYVKLVAQLAFSLNKPYNPTGIVIERYNDRVVLHMQISFIVGNWKDIIQQTLYVNIIKININVIPSWFYLVSVFVWQMVESYHWNETIQRKWIF